MFYSNGERVISIYFGSDEGLEPVISGRYIDSERGGNLERAGPGEGDLLRSSVGNGFGVKLGISAGEVPGTILVDAYFSHEKYQKVEFG